MKTATTSFGFKLFGLAPALAQMFAWMLTLTLALLAGCASKLPAPVSDARPPIAATSTAPPVNITVVKPGETTPAPEAAKPSSPQPIDPTKFHTVQKGDTLYSVAFQHSLDRRELAAWNNIENPNVIRIGDNLRLTAPDANPSSISTTVKPGEPVTAPLVLTPSVAPSSALEARPQNSNLLKVEPKAGRVPYTDQVYARLSNEAAAIPTAPATSTPIPPITTSPAPAAVPPTATSPNENIDWAWPVKGKVTATFTDMTKGIDVPGTRNAPILAAAPGKVIYNKSGLRGYGRLIIIRHSETWLSAYAHNEKVLVAEDELVKKGQKIAEMGSSDTDTVKMHFEIRKNGKPVDPLKLLPQQ